MKKNIRKTSRGSMERLYIDIEKLINGEHKLKNILLLPAVFDKKRGNVPVFIYEENGKTKELKYKDYYQEVLKYAKSLNIILKNIDKNSFIAFKMNNSYKWPLIFWGLIFSGYRPLLINSILDKETTQSLINEGGAKAIISDDGNEYLVPSFKVNNIKILDSDYSPVCANEVALCTSGTTGQSRIYVYDGEALCYQIYAAYNMPNVTPDIMYEGSVRQLALLPFSHIFGLIAILLWYTYFKTTIVFPSSNSPEALINTIKKYKCTHIYAVPLFWDTLANKFNQQLAKESNRKISLVNKFMDYNNNVIAKSEAGVAHYNLTRRKIQKEILGDQIVYCISGGSSLSKDTLKTINGLGYHLYNGYGMTEIGITSVELSPNVKQRNRGSCGKALVNVEYKIENNELLVKSPYLHTYRLINGEKVDADIDKDGYFHTGDLALLDDEGYLFIKGKCKDVIILNNGENVYPDEIETKFKTVAGIDELTVLSIKENEQEKIALFFHLIDDANLNNVKIALEEINNSIALRMRVQKFVLAKNNLPINPSLKIKKYVLLEEYKTNKDAFINLNNEMSSLDNSCQIEEARQIIDKVKQIFSTELNRDYDEINNNDHLIIDLNGDSFTYMSIIYQIEQEFNIHIPSEKLSKLNTVNDFASYILKNMN